MSGPFILPWQGIMPRIAADAFIAPNATVIGDVEIGSRSSIWFGVVVRGDVAPIRVGARTNLQDNTVVHVASAAVVGTAIPTIIGDDVLVGHSAILHACTVENGAFIGMASKVLDKAVIESGAMVAACAMVGPGKRVPRGELWSGTPARLMRKLTEEEIAGFSRGTDHYAELGAAYRKQIAGKS